MKKMCLFLLVMEINVKIRKIRTFKGYSQTHIANELGISQRAYSKIELNETRLTWRTITRISEILEVGIWELVNVEKDYNPDENKLTENIDLLERLIHQYEDRIKSLETEVTALRLINNN